MIANKDLNLACFFSNALTILVAFPIFFENCSHEKLLCYISCSKHIATDFADNTFEYAIWIFGATNGQPSLN